MGEQTIYQRSPDAWQKIEKAGYSNLTEMARRMTSASVMEYGKPFTANGFGNKMREWCDAAGLPQCSSHGLRKAAARRLAEAGCTHAQIKAITGHTTDAEVSRYINAANQEVLADQAMDAIEGDNSVRQRPQKAIENQ